MHHPEAKNPATLWQNEIGVQKGHISVALLHPIEFRQFQEAFWNQWLGRRGSNPRPLPKENCLDE